MKYLSRNDLEAIGARVIAAYKKLPAISGQPLERVDIDYLCQALLGLRIDYARLSLEGEKIGLTSSCEVGVEVFSEDPACEEELYYMLDGKTILIEGDLIKEGANVGRRNYTVSHESCHHILKMLFPRDYGAQARGRSVHYCYRSNHRNGDWEEWQVETLAAIILLPPECVIRNMERFGIGTQMRLLNRVFAPADYSKFEDMASFMGVSKTAMSIRMTQLGLLKRNDLIPTVVITHPVARRTQAVSSILRVGHLVIAFSNNLKYSLMLIKTKPELMYVIISDTKINIKP